MRSWICGRIFLGVVTVGCIATVTSSLLAAPDFLPAVDGKWHYYQSPNFELYSKDTDGQSREILHNLELLRAAFTQMFKLAERRRLEVTVIRFNRGKDFLAYLPSSFSKKADFSAYYTSGTDRALIVLGPSNDEDATQEIIFHEYIHHLFRVSGEDPPVWVNEGTAELFSTVVAKPNGLEVGRPSKGRLIQLRLDNMMKFEQLFAIDHSSPVFRTGSHTGLFYAEAWALMHYWYFGQSDLTSKQVDGFISSARGQPPPSGAILRQCFKENFNMDYGEMEKRLDRYTTSGRYGIIMLPLPKIDQADSYPKRLVPVEEARLRLAELALRTNRSPQAKLILLESVQKAPTDPRLFEVLAADALHDDDERTARIRWQQALDAGTRNPAAFRELGRMECNAWFQQIDIYFQLPADSTVRLRQLLLKSIEYAPEQTDAYEMLACVEAFSAKPSNGNVNLVQSRYPTLKNQHLTLLALAIVRHHVSDDATALAMLTELDKMNPSEYICYAMEALRAKIEGREMRWTAGQMATPPTIKIKPGPPSLKP